MAVDKNFLLKLEELLKTTDYKSMGVDELVSNIYELAKNSLPVNSQNGNILELTPGQSYVDYLSNGTKIEFIKEAPTSSRPNNVSLKIGRWYNNSPEMEVLEDLIKRIEILEEKWE